MTTVLGMVAVAAACVVVVADAYHAGGVVGLSLDFVVTTGVAGVGTLDSVAGVPHPLAVVTCQ